ncbi:hypothetical protein HBI56_214970 [Parastagonospora nodorum]|nr:hypothetical protein HBH56_230930 [Parastagonospora nodorum]KAH3924474.1 hypothetical protein HBH54_194230 [Parastagonospora nodorum]KAH3940126.1 hypothetical protein HBH53_221800 [Parastagonospora nodorum]KAH3958353.1 hypothetical protein HBH51_210650 [Parastagonospora nodorum]KAH3960267.1 hypothetical protein HBH52_237950 [Parastagonospora nodorum]
MPAGAQSDNFYITPAFSKPTISLRKCLLLSNFPLFEMKFPVVLVLAALANVIQAFPVVESRSPSLEARGGIKCNPPGEHRCAAIVWVTIQSNGLDLGTGTSRGVQVVGGNCDNIIASGKLIRGDGGSKGRGWSADFTTTYGPHLYIGITNLGIRTISGVRFQYNGKSYEQKHCKGFQDHDSWRIMDVPGLVGSRAIDAMQCNFDC